MSSATSPVVSARPSPALRTRLLYEAHVDMGPPLDVGVTPHGARHIAPIRGGTFEGPALRGEILSGGADWALARPDGVTELDIRVAARCDDGAILYARERGYLRAAPDLLPRLAAGEQVDPDAYSVRIVTFYETASPEYAWLNGTIGVGAATFRRGGLDLVVHEVL